VEEQDRTGSSPASDRLPIAVAVINDYEIVIEGVACMLARFPERAQVCERIIVGEPIDHPPIDVALYDTYGRVGIASEALERLRVHRDILHIAMFTLDLAPALIEEGRRFGSTGFISKTLSAEEIMDALVLVADGEEVVARGADAASPVPADLDWPGKDHGLTERESQVLVLASEGLTNAEIGKALYVGSETVKSHLSRAYAKLGVHNRAGAVRFVLSTGTFDRSRPTEEALDET
jgi:DNA-binding NarL/FixJ family response regulator